MPRRLLLIALCVSTLAIAASGCGGGGSTSSSGAKPEVWAADVCGALSEWAQGMQTDGRAIGTGKKDLKSVKGKFVLFIQQSVRRSDAMLSKVKAVGAPAVKQGPALQSDLLAVLRRARDGFANALPQARALSTTDQRTFQRQVLELSKAVQKELTATGQTFDQIGDKYKDKDLNEATSKDPACKKLSSRSSG